MNTEILQKLRENIGKVMIGNEGTISLVLTSLLAEDTSFWRICREPGKRLWPRRWRNPFRENFAEFSLPRIFCRRM